MTYRQITSEQRYMLAALRMQGLKSSEIALVLGCHRSTVGRELRRNCSASDGRYRADKAQEKTNGRRCRSRRNQQFTSADFDCVETLLEQRWSPEQIAGRLALEKKLSISHETIYRHVWHDKKFGGLLYTHLRCAQKRRRKGYGHYDSRGRLAGKRHISQRPPSVESRQEFGHWEIDTVMGTGSTDCILSLVERKTGLVVIGKLRAELPRR
jgi:IS30 family transposase